MVSFFVHQNNLIRAYIRTCEMPVRTVRTRHGPPAVISVSIPVSSLPREDEEEDELTCYICANSFCPSDCCGRTLTHLGCCTQAICCACLLKGCKRCTCKEECDAVISLCPFCREIAPVDALDMFLGGKPPCKECLSEDSASGESAGAGESVVNAEASVVNAEASVGW